MVSDLLSAELRQDFSQASIDAITVEGKQYAIRFEQEPVALLYNTDLFTKSRSPGPKNLGRALGGL